MSGTLEGGRKAAAKNKAHYGEDFYKRLGSLGGRASRSGGFAANRALAREAGRKGGLASRRTKSIYIYKVEMDGEVIAEGKLTSVATLIGYSTAAIYQAAKRGTPLGEYDVTRRENK